MKSLSVLLLSLCLFVHPSRAEEKAKPPMSDFVGLNGHFDFKPELYRQVCRLVRNYHNMDWDVKRPGDAPTFPLCVNQVNWKDHVYGPWVKAGFSVDLCAQFGGFGRENAQYQALWKEQEEWAYRYGFEMAKYFGPSGENLCTSIEIDNEPGTGFDDPLYQRIFLNMAKGIREGDPKMKIVTCTAQARAADDYSKNLDETFASAEILPLYDVINLHVYAVTPKKDGQSPWHRSYPEDPAIDYLKIVDEAIAWRDKNAPGKEIWITEFGWDACTDEAMKHRTGWFEKLNWQGVTDLQQAQYLVRSLLCFAERDVNRAYIYYYNDKDEPSVHAASGLTRNFQPKMSFWALKHFSETLGGYRFARVVQKVENDRCIYEFVHTDDPDSTVWVVWSPTGSGYHKQITMTLPYDPVEIERMPTEENAAPIKDWDSLSPRTLLLQLDESPLYIRMRK